MGKGAKQKAQLVEIFAHYIIKEAAMMTDFLALADHCYQQPLSDNFNRKCQYFSKTLKTSGYLK